MSKLISIATVASAAMLSLSVSAQTTAPAPSGNLAATVQTKVTAPSTTLATKTVAPIIKAPAVVIEPKPALTIVPRNGPIPQPSRTGP